MGAELSMHAPGSLLRAQNRFALAGALFWFPCAAGCSAKHETDQRACLAPPTRIGVGTTFNLCPTVDSVDVNPSSAEVGADVDLEATADDPDDKELTYSWTASSGVFADPMAESTSYRCTAPGIATIVFTVSDGLCSDDQMVAVSCVPRVSDAGSSDAGR
jgi:hypothetical protein